MCNCTPSPSGFVNLGGTWLSDRVEILAIEPMGRARSQSSPFATDDTVVHISHGPRQVIVKASSTEVAAAVEAAQQAKHP